MDQSFYMGAVGAHQQLRRLNVQGNNIANVNTYGFKADKARFATLMYQNMRGIDEDQPYGVGTQMLTTTADHLQGAPADTGRDQDYMIDGSGYFALADLATGEITFTRNGAFYPAEYWRQGSELDENGLPAMERVYCLSDGEGRFVLSDTGGLIEMEDFTEEMPVGIFDYTNYDGMVHMTDTRFLPVDKNGNLLRGDGKLLHGKLEMSNTDLAEEITKVIESQRAYGLALKLVQTSDEIETTINGLRS